MRCGRQVGFRSKFDKEIPLLDGEDAEAAWKMFSLRQVPPPLTSLVLSR